MRLGLLVLALLILIAPVAAQLEPAGNGLNVTMNHIPLWFVFKYATQYTITDYNFTPWASYPDNNSWMILGSNDGLAFYTLDTRINVSLPDIGTTYSFTLPVTGSYRYYNIYLFTNLEMLPGWSTTGDKLEVHLYAASAEPAPEMYNFGGYQAEPLDLIPLIMGVTGFIAIAGWRRARRNPGRGNMEAPT